MCNPADNVRDLQSDVQRLGSLRQICKQVRAYKNESLVDASWPEGNQSLLDQHSLELGALERSLKS